MNEEPYYLGFFANVDSNIKKLKLDYNFAIEEMSPDEYRKFIDSTDKQYEGLKNVLLIYYGIVTDDNHKIYFIKGLPSNLGGNRRYILDLITKLRLFKEGFVSIPVQIDKTYIEDGKIRKAQQLMYAIGVSKKESVYTLTDAEVIKLNKFIKEIKLPLKQFYLELALENLEESMRINRIELKFLILMIGFESLFNLSENQITHTISRHTAILTGNSPTESEEIYVEMKNYYKKRSKLVHANYKTMNKINIKKEEIVRMRELLRECIKKIYRLDLTKKDLFQYLNKKGF